MVETGSLEHCTDVVERQRDLLVVAIRDPPGLQVPAQHARDIQSIVSQNSGGVGFLHVDPGKRDHRLHRQITNRHRVDRDVHPVGALMDSHDGSRGRIRAEVPGIGAVHAVVERDVVEVDVRVDNVVEGEPAARTIASTLATA